MRILEALDVAKRTSILQLLRWRLERCEDVLTLSRGWDLSPWENDDELFPGNILLLTTLQQGLFQGGESLLSAPLWDALMDGVFELMLRVYREDQGPVRQLQQLATQVPLLVEELTALEQEAAAELPPAMLRVLVDNLLLRQLPSLG